MMRRLRPRLLLSQIGISFLISLLMGTSTITLARAYFLGSLEAAMDVQARLISEAVFPGSSLPDEGDPARSEFNTVQQQIGNLSVEIQGLDSSEPLLPTDIFQSSRQIQAFESIDLVVGFTTLEGEHLLQPDHRDVPRSFFPAASPETSRGNYSGEVKQDQDGQEWLVKSYPVLAGGVHQGILTLGQPLEALRGVLLDLGWRVGAAGLVALMLAILISALSTRGFLAPITALMHASRAIPQGRFDEPLPIDRGDELGELSRTFEEMRDKLEALEKLRSQLISDVSHELRTPLTAIKGLTETLRDGAVEDPQVRDRFLASIEDETDRLIRMTRDLLMLTRIDAQSLSLEFGDCDLKAALQSTIQTLRSRMEQGRIKLRLDLPPGRVTIQADKDRLIQIFFNLLDNAIQHSPLQSEITVMIERGQVKDPGLQSYLTLIQPVGGVRPSIDSMDPQVTWVLLTIRDNGAGIDPEDLKHIFERFYRTDSSRERSAGGAGLGLAIASALVNAHGGYLWLHSPPSTEDQHGTLAILLLPETQP